MTKSDWTLLLAMLALLSGCADPVHAAEVDALGPEAPGVRRGPLHRPGQPCLVCHGGSGPGGRVFSMAGTVYQHASDATPAVSASVSLIDAAGSAYVAQTNCAGNFYIEDNAWTPTYPVHVPSTSLGAIAAVMNTHIGRDGSCASCHTGENTTSTVDRVFLAPPGVVVESGGRCP